MQRPDGVQKLPDPPQIGVRPDPVVVNMAKVVHDLFDWIVYEPKVTHTKGVPLDITLSDEETAGLLRLLELSRKNLITPERATRLNKSGWMDSLRARIIECDQNDRLKRAGKNPQHTHSLSPDRVESTSNVPSPGVDEEG